MMTPPALGFLELNSISRGLYLTDVVVKKAPVKIIASQPISSGKHVVLYMGDVASVKESHRAALDLAENTLVREIMIPGIHEQLAPFLYSLSAGETRRNSAGESVGIVESATLSGAILAADHALKMARVSLCRMRLGQGIGGKAYFVLAGRQEEVEAALEASARCLVELDSMGRIDVIPRPQEEAFAHF